MEGQLNNGFSVGKRNDELELFRYGLPGLEVRTGSEVSFSALQMCFPIVSLTNEIGHAIFVRLDDY